MVVVGTVTQTVVWVVETEIVVRPLRKVTEVLVVQTMAVFREGNATRFAGNETLLRGGVETVSGGISTDSPLRLSGSGQGNDTARASNLTDSVPQLQGTGQANMRHAALTASG